MRLLLLTNVFPNPWQPTKGTFNLELVRALAKEHEVRVVSPVAWTDEWRLSRTAGGPEESRRRGTLGGAEVYYPRYLYTPALLRDQYGWFLWQSVRPTVGRILDEWRPDSVVGYWAHPDGEVAVRVARKAGVPGVVMVGGSDVLLLAKSGARQRKILNVLHEADAVVTVGLDLKARLVEFGIHPEKIHLVYRGVDSEAFSPGDRSEARARLGIPADGPAFLWVGRMVPVKGLDVLIEAAKLLKGRGIDFRLYLAGAGQLRGTLEDQVKSAGLGDTITFVGSVPHDRLPDWYRAVDRTVLPSRSEGIPNVLRESLACGTPFVASRVGGIPELADEPSDRLVPPGDPSALAEAMAASISDAGNRTTAVLRPRTESWDESARALVRILEDLAGRVTPAGSPTR